MRLLFIRGPGSSVGIATELLAGRFGGRISVGERYSAPVQTGPGAHPPTPLYNEYRVFPSGKKRPVHDADPSPLSSAVVIKE